MFEADLVTLLKNNPALSAKVGTRIYPLVMPTQPTFPCIVYQVVASTRTYSHSGFSHLFQPRIQFSCWATTYAEAKDVASKLKAALEGFRGISGGTTLQGAFVATDIDDYEPGTKLYRVITDFYVWAGE